MAGLWGQGFYGGGAGVQRGQRLKISQPEKGRGIERGSIIRQGPWRLQDTRKLGGWDSGTDGHLCLPIGNGAQEHSVSIRIVCPSRLTRGLYGLC